MMGLGVDSHLSARVVGKIAPVYIANTPVMNNVIHRGVYCGTGWVD